MQYTKRFGKFLLSLSTKFSLSKNRFSIFLVVFAKLSMQHEKNSMFLSNITSNQKLSCGYNLLISKTFFIMSFRNLSRSIFSNIAENGFKYLTKFLWVLWNIDRINWIELYCPSVGTGCLILGIKSLPRKFKPPYPLKFCFWVWFRSIGVTAIKTCSFWRIGQHISLPKKSDFIRINLFLQSFPCCTEVL